MIEQRVKQLETGMSRLAQAVGQAAQAQQDAEQEKVKNLLIEIQSKLYDRASTYTNLIMVGAYAGMFATWSATRANLPLKANIVIALSIGISLASFILFEVYKMTITAIKFMKNRSLLVTPATPQVFGQNLKKLQLEEQKLSLFFIPVWIIVMVVSVGSGLFALGLLFYNYFALLAGWSAWPAST